MASSSGWGARLQQADVRLISATHLLLSRYLETDHFRKDLFYRISGITLRLPALRQRPNDLRVLMATAIEGAGAALGKNIVGLSRAAANRLLAYDWPGNLRELHRLIHTAVAITDGEVTSPEAILLETSIEVVGANASEALANLSAASAPTAADRESFRASSDLSAPDPVPTGAPRSAPSTRRTMRTILTDVRSKFLSLEGEQSRRQVIEALGDEASMFATDCPHSERT